ncbi:ABC transporter CDR4 [Fusarium venenatum]|uniref:ABC transporter domain-containing protein n=1 Tax=Fusarium venenatum TaxID=56646 RepID=A0A2L2SU49_9HYPO|nr:uncharacterized protein FVRRES_13692 [Fusarium venenatum]KAG8358586.1 ABC transporter CDR4 [Fusarium venenatum]CEI41683.1 unnamed protein product [Fusarium venenatum]
MDDFGKKSANATHDEVAGTDDTNSAPVHLLRLLKDENLHRKPGSREQVNGRNGSTDSVLQKLGLHDQTLNPSSPTFDFQEWSRLLVRLRNHLNVPTPPRSGFTFKSLTVHGSSSGSKHQDTVWTLLTFPLNFRTWFRQKETKTILQGLDGVVHKGELLLVLGRPGSGCSTFLKTITGQMGGLEIGPGSSIQYTGVPHQIMTREFQGELIYNGEVDEHLPYLTVGQTLEFAAAMRTPRARLPGITRKDRVKHVVQVVLTIFGLSHTKNTIVGNDYVRGVSGGERKRVSIAETALSEAAISAWDNSTKGLDAESALHFVSRLRTLSDLTQTSSAAAIYQSSQAIFDLFDKILVLYKGREIFFGHASSASAYFERMGWHRHPRQTSGDYLTTITDPEQRVAKEGQEDSVPRTPEEFSNYWINSPEYASLMREIKQCHKDSDLEQETTRKQFQEIRHKLKAKGMLRRATQTVSFPMQTALCVKRSVQQLWNDKGSTLTTLVGEIIIALVVGSIFYGTPDTTDAFFAYGSVLFFSVLLNVLMSVTDIHNLYRGRSVITKQVSYAFYRPSADALASVLVDIPVKFVIGVFFNVILYFLAGLALTASQFFIFFLFVFTTTLAMSMVFRTIAAATVTLPQAMALSGFLVLALVTYTGFVLPSPYMHPWFKWISYINPLSYAFEALLVNQAHGTNYPCSHIVPSYQDLVGDTFICPVPGSAAGQTYVNGDAWFETSYDYSYSHLWRNLGIIFGFLFFFLFLYLLISDLNVNTSVGADILVFLGNNPATRKADTKLKGRVDVEQPLVVNNTSIEVATVEETVPQVNQAVFAWRKLNFDVVIKGEPRRLLDEACGWVKPGSMVALMGVSGAGKTTLLNALAQRMPTGQIQGEFFVNGGPLPPSFKSDVGYVQQQDVHLETSTVREALQFSAMLRQSSDVPIRQKLQFAEETIHLLGMDDFADAIIGLPGKGLNAEQRKRLSIGVELAGKPSLLLFLDEPTSGLDSQSSEAILALLKRLAGGGLGILCTIHQPSAMLFQRFDRLLLMARGGKVAYFGDIGKDSEDVLRYFGARAHRKCKGAENPAEYILGMIGNTENQQIDWSTLWNQSPEAKVVTTELESVSLPSSKTSLPDRSAQVQRSGSYPLPLISQLPIVCQRVFRQYWRSTTYIASKFMLGICGTLFIGFSFFQPGQSILGTQNAIFSILMVCAMFSSLVQQIMPKFIMQRTIYEVREKHSNMYSWVVLILSNILVEIPYHIVLGVMTFATFNYTVFGIRSSQDQVLVLLFFTYFYMLIGTFAVMVTAPLPDATTAGRITTVLFSMMLLFAGVFQVPSALPGFWIFMYRVSPMTYLVGGIAVSGLAGNQVRCSQSELAIFQPPAGQTCGSYMQAYLEQGASGTLLNPGATTDCSYCPLTFADQILARSDMHYSDRWMDWGVGFAYIAFNVGATFLFYSLSRLGLLSLGIRKVSQLFRRERSD